MCGERVWPGGTPAVIEIKRRARTDQVYCTCAQTAQGFYSSFVLKRLCNLLPKTNKNKQLSVIVLPQLLSVLCSANHWKVSEQINLRYLNLVATYNMIRLLENNLCESATELLRCSYMPKQCIKQITWSNKVCLILIIDLKGTGRLIKGGYMWGVSTTGLSAFKVL